MIKKVRLTNIKIWTDKPSQYGSFPTNFTCEEFGTEWISGFAKEFNHKAGDVIEVDIVQSETINQKTGKPYTNWKWPNKDSAVNDKIAKIEFSIANIHRKIDQIVAEIKKMQSTGLTSAGTKVPDFTPNTPEEAEEFGRKMATYEEANAILDEEAEKLFAKM